MAKAAEVSPEDIITLEASVEELELEDHRKAIIIDCRFYLGMTVDEVAKLLDLSKITVEREERKARTFLSTRIRPSE
jgi:RNA polymerase sigma-70 factor, ECF subfamily